MCLIILAAWFFKVSSIKEYFFNSSRFSSFLDRTTSIVFPPFFSPLAKWTGWILSNLLLLNYSWSQTTYNGFSWLPALLIKQLRWTFLACSRISDTDRLTEWGDVKVEGMLLPWAFRQVKLFVTLLCLLSDRSHPYHHVTSAKLFCLSCWLWLHSFTIIQFRLVFFCYYKFQPS